MIAHPPRPLEHLTGDQEEAVLQTAFIVLSETGLLIPSAESVRRLQEAGCPLSGDRLLFPRSLCEEYLAQAPAQFILRARDPRYDVTVGGNRLLLSPGYGSAFVADAAGARREATLDDFRRFATLAANSEPVDITGGLLVEPHDVAPECRPEVLTRALIECSPKPFLGSVAGAEGARQSLAVARDALPDLEGAAAVVGLININSPLRLDGRMAEALLAYVQAGQPVLLTPGILMGVTAPVTVAGALAQAFAELIGVVVLTQVLRPGAPVIVGLGGFGSDLRTAGSGFGRPEQALGALLGAQMARRLRLPYRASPGATGAFTPDARAGYESAMTAFTAWSGGVHVALQAFGILDQINAMSYEKFVLDLEMWAYLQRVAAPPQVDADHLAADTVAACPADYLAAEHTLRHFREAIFAPDLAPPLSYDAWLARGRPDALGLAGEKLRADHT